MDVLNLYDDLDVDLGADIEKLEAENKELKSTVKTLKEDLKEKAEAIERLKKENDTLNENISRLYVTAKEEIARKDNSLIELRLELDNLLFKRNKTENQSNYKNRPVDDSLSKPNQFNAAIKNAPTDKVPTTKPAKPTRENTFDEHNRDRNYNRTRSASRPRNNAISFDQYKQRKKDERVADTTAGVDNPYRSRSRENSYGDQNRSYVGSRKRSRSRSRDYDGDQNRSYVGSRKRSRSRSRDYDNFKRSKSQHSYRGSRSSQLEDRRHKTDRRESEPYYERKDSGSSNWYIDRIKHGSREKVKYDTRFDLRDLVKNKDQRKSESNDSYRCSDVRTSGFKKGNIQEKEMRPVRQEESVLKERRTSTKLNDTKAKVISNEKITVLSDHKELKLKNSIKTETITKANNGLLSNQKELKLKDKIKTEINPNKDALLSNKRTAGKSDNDIKTEIIKLLSDDKESELKKDSKTETLPKEKLKPKEDIKTEINPNAEALSSHQKTVEKSGSVIKTETVHCSQETISKVKNGCEQSNLDDKNCLEINPETTENILSKNKESICAASDGLVKSENLDTSREGATDNGSPLQIINTNSIYSKQFINDKVRITVQRRRKK